VLELKTPREIEAMRVTGTFVAELLDDLAARAQVGVNLLDLEHRARQLIDRRGAVSCYWDYAPSFGRGPFRNVICLRSTMRCCTGCRTTTPCVMGIC